MAQSTFIPLEDLRIASPCRADWDKMQGDDRVRFCQTCAKNVYNLSSMSRTEAEELIRAQEGKLCIRYYQRADGTILTDNCPVGVKIVRRPFQWLAACFAALLVSGLSIVHSHQAYPNCKADTNAALSQMQPFKGIMAWYKRRSAPPVMMGAMNTLSR